MIGVRRTLAAALVLALTSGCGGGARDPDIDAWGEQALEWLDALELAAANGIQHLEPFLDPDVVWEDRVSMEFLEGEHDWFEDRLDGDLWGVFLPRGGATYLVSTHGAVGQRIIDFDPPIAFLDRMTIGPDGMRHWIRSESIDALRLDGTHHLDLDRYDELANRYVALWDGTKGVAAESIYRPDAAIDDGLLGRSLSGLAEIEVTAESDSWTATRRVSLVDLPDQAGRAVFAAPSRPDGAGPTELALVIEVDDRTGCRTRVAVALGLVGDRIAWERRHHDVETVRRCEDPPSSPGGWWEDIRIPDLVVPRTGTVSFGDVDVAIFGGTPELGPFVRWGLSRFVEAGLEVPSLASLTFLDARVECYNLAGRSEPTTQGAAVTLCRTSDDICVDDPCRHWRARDRQLLLHEFAHLWIAEHLDDDVRADFLESVGLPRWSDPADPWSERGVEHAAHTIAHGLMDEPVDLAPELGTECDDLHTGFRILTGTDPIAECSGEPR